MSNTSIGPDWLRRVVRSALPWIARLHRYNWLPRRWKYPQLWCVTTRWFPRWSGDGRLRPNPQLQKMQRVCQWWTGHELSKTEWGHSGGNMVDHHCRWCDFVIRVPLSESPPPQPVLRLLDAIDKDLTES